METYKLITKLNKAIGDLKVRLLVDINIDKLSKLRDEVQAMLIQLDDTIDKIDIELENKRHDNI